MSIIDKTELAICLLCDQPTERRTIAETFRYLCEKCGHYDISQTGIDELPLKKDEYREIVERHHRRIIPDLRPIYPTFKHREQRHHACRLIKTAVQMDHPEGDFSIRPDDEFDNIFYGSPYDKHVLKQKIILKAFSLTNGLPYFACACCEMVVAEYGWKWPEDELISHEEIMEFIDIEGDTAKREKKARKDKRRKAILNNEV